MSERVLITGGAGFIGAKLAAIHAATGDDVHVIVRPSGLIRSGRTVPKVVVARMHLDDVDALSNYLSKARPTIIYHLASDTGRGARLSSSLDSQTAIGDLHNFLALLKAARTVAPRVLVRSGSLAEYGNGSTPSRESQREQPLSAYTTAMVAGAHYAKLLQPSLPFAIQTARLALTYGEGQSDTFLIPRLIERCLAGAPCEVRHPSRRRDLIHVADAVAGLRALASPGLPAGSIVNLCSGVAPAIGDVARQIVDLAGADPALISYGDDAETETEISTVLGCPDLARVLMGWTATIPLNEGLARTVSNARQRIDA